MVMARDDKITVLWTSKQALNEQASFNNLLFGEPYLITDEQRLAVGLSPSTYAEFAKKSEAVISGIQFTFSRPTGLVLSDKLLAVAPYNGTITGWSILSEDGTPVDLTIEVFKSTYANPNAFGSIHGANPLNLAASSKNSSTDISTWSTSILAGDNIKIAVAQADLSYVRGVYGIINITKV